ncbi:cysteine hydrolase [Pseudomonas sp. JM0905a]|uniref:cysteine hydrolase family protein n=1 Tax=Pseudomonas sp. JM0905a TaxID=2772484 RepID=UPI001689E2D0|nr:isochorismatase family cysteine hydrolase [Pseudomonas sp. JM0905a]MBD2837813.1 cysteine hydrolase [Pseudomonas sp. JM0905a]
MKRVDPVGMTRETLVNPQRTALLIVDVQNAEVSPYIQETQPEYYNRVMNEVVPRIKTLIQTAREAGSEVIYTVIESLTRDGRDRSLDHKLSGLLVPKGAWGGKVVDEIAPGEDDIVLPKTSSGVFNSTNLDYVLRNLGVEAVVVVGVLTDQCIDMAVRDGADRGYFMVCVSDACASYTEARHENALAAFGGYCRTSTTARMAAELSGQL